MQKDTRADAAMAEIMLALLDSMEASEAGTIDHTGTEFLHDFRVAVRRTRTALTQLKSVMPAHDLARFVAAFAWLGDITTPTRDLDIYLLKFKKLRHTLPKKLRGDLRPFRDYLETRQREEQARLADALRSADYRKLKQEWRDFLTSGLPCDSTAVPAATPIGDFSHRRIWRMYKRVLREGRAITPASPATALHEMRKSCKKLRYLMEFFQSLYPPKQVRRLIRELKTLQENLGDFQDLQVQAHTLSGYCEKMRRAGTLQPPTRLAIDALQDRLQHAASDARGDFKRRFKRFSCKQNRQKFRQLFHDDTGQ